LDAYLWCMRDVNLAAGNHCDYSYHLEQISFMCNVNVRSYIRGICHMRRSGDTVHTLDLLTSN
jgi:hypothetical protein